MTSMRLATVSVLVRDYDEALAWFTGKLGFECIADIDLGGAKRWVVVCPTGQAGATLLLAQADGDEQFSMIGRQGGGRVWLFLHTGDFAASHAAMLVAGVKFLEEPRHEAYGIVAVFEDLCGNRWDLTEPKA